MNMRSALPIIGILCLAACRGDLPAAPAGSAALFKLVPDPVLSDEQHAAFNAIKSRGISAKIHIGRIVDAPERILEEGRPLRISLAPWREVIALREHMERWAENLSWFGNLQNGRGTVVLMLSTEGVDAVVQTRTAIYRIEPIGSGLHVISRLDPTKMPPPEGPCVDLVGALESTAPPQRS